VENPCSRAEKLQPGEGTGKSKREANYLSPAYRIAKEAKRRQFGAELWKSGGWKHLISSGEETKVRTGIK